MSRVVLSCRDPVDWQADETKGYEMRSVLLIALGSALALASANPAFAAPDQLFLPHGGGHMQGGHGPGGHGGGPGPHMGGPGGPGQHFGGGGPGPGQHFGGGPGQHFGGGQDGEYRHHRGYGAAVGVGVAGLAAGALIGGAIANQGDYYGGAPYGYGYGDPGYAEPGPVADEDVESAPVGGDAEAYCAQRYRSYDPSSGTFMGLDGVPHPCP